MHKFIANYKIYYSFIRSQPVNFSDAIGNEKL